MSASPAVSMPSAPTLILWDLVGSCNLKCPSCPMGSMRGSNPRGFITDELFKAILAKLKREFACRPLHFYNWTEPLLHPKIIEYCRSAAAAGFHVHLSSNLNHLPDPSGLVTCGVKTIRISLSGYSQATYRIGHRGGDIERVKANMRRLAEARQATGSRTRIHVYFHKYRHNLNEMRAMEALAEELGFGFVADWAFLMPLEKILAYAGGTLPEDERIFADRHFLPQLDRALRLVQEQGGRDRPCALIEQLVLDHLGRATLCCATYDSGSNVIDDYLSLDWAQLQQARYRHATCTQCTAIGAHTFCTSVSDPALREEMAKLASTAAAEIATEAGGPISLPILAQRVGELAQTA
jgi:MoaA/NifB/PqqE/SkfB family radical SAM enzyme